MATAHLLYGFIGAGKTTFARKLETQINAVRFSHDEWMTTLYGNNPDAALFDEYWMRVNRILTENWKRLLSLGVDVIIDEGFWHRARRDDIRAIVHALGATSRLYHVTCSEKLMLERTRKRNEDTAGSFYIDDAAFSMLRERVEPLGSDEPYETVRTDP